LNAALRPMREDEFPAYVAAAKEQYAADMVENAGFSRTAAELKAESDFAVLFPDGFATDGIFLRIVEDDGERVGHVLYAQREQFGRPAAFLYEILIDEDCRGRGLGRRAMGLFEDEVRAHGLSRVELNVFGGNAVARSLYRTLGYEERAVFMERVLA
jgi:ribosomal protein S18 acetylase RimI-like enzyme